MMMMATIYLVLTMGQLLAGDIYMHFSPDPYSWPIGFVLLSLPSYSEETETQYVQQLSEDHTASKY